MSTTTTNTYDDLCEYIRAVTRASGVVLIIEGGNRGSALSCTPRLNPVPILYSYADAFRAAALSAAAVAIPDGKNSA